MREEGDCDKPRRGVVGLEENCRGQQKRLVANRRVQPRVQQERRRASRQKLRPGGAADSPKLEACLREFAIVKVKIKSLE